MLAFASFVVSAQGVSFFVQGSFDCGPISRLRPVRSDKEQMNMGTHEVTDHVLPAGDFKKKAVILVSCDLTLGACI